MTAVLTGGHDQGVFYPVKIKDAPVRWRENPGVKIQRLEHMSVCAFVESAILTELSYKTRLPQGGHMVPQ